MSPKIKLSAQYLLLFFIIFNPIWNDIHSQLLNYRQGQLIVQLQAGSDWTSIQTNSLKQRSNSILKTVEPLRKLGPYWNIWLVQFDFNKIKHTDLINEFRSYSEVLNVQINHLIQSRTLPNDPYFLWQWHHVNDGSNGRNLLADFDSDLAWDLTTGGLTDQGDTIVICIIDDGLDIFHEDIYENLWHNYNEIPNNGKDDDQNGYVDDFNGWNSYKRNDSFDQGKHGTPVCGLAMAKGNNAKGIAGICWNIQLMFVAGGGDEANALESYAYPLWFRRQFNQSKGKKGAFVVATNSSWGTDNARPEDAPVWCAIYDTLGLEGIISVASTTNQNVDVDIEGDLPTTCESDYLVTVTNMTDLNVKDINAGYGKKSIDIGAYGESVYSCYLNNGYRTFSGTSAASPQVTGAIGLIYSLPCNNLSTLAITQPQEAALETKRILLNSVRKNSSLQSITTSEGVLNLFQSLDYISPIYVKKISLTSIELAWDGSLIYPLKFRYRLKDKTSWMDTLIYTGNQLLLEHLESCSEYELQYKNACSRYTERYSPIRIYKTIGCCEAPFDFKILNKTKHEIKILFKDPSASGQLTTLLRLSNSIKWDTFVFQTPSNEFTLSNLESCVQYELRCFNYCNNRITPLSQSIYLNTDGCEQCTTLDYCKRYRPSSDLEWLDAIIINNQKFRSGNNTGYGNFTGSGQSYYFEKNKSYSFEVEAGYLNDSSKMVLAVWIDYNQDGNFETIENIAIPTATFKYSKSYMFSIPATAKSGYTRMRVCLKYAEVSEATPLPCFQSLEFGEYEDYCVFISDNLCDPISDLAVNSINTVSGNFTISALNGNSYNYAFRKLPASNWIFGTSNFKTIQLTNLDSCSRYEIQVVSVCPENLSKPFRYRFQTSGTNCIVSTQNNEFSSISVYPNPFTNILKINNPDRISLNKMYLYSTTGKLLLQQIISADSNFLLFSDHLTPGVYFVKLVSHQGTSKTFSVIKQ